MENASVLTKEGKRKLEAERDHLIKVEREVVIQEIKEARSQGDLSENSEFDAAREKQGKIEERILEIESIIKNSKIINNNVSTKVNLGSTVQVINTKTKEESTYTIVGTLEVDPFKGKISNQSLIALALMEKSVGDKVTVRTPKPYELKITKITN